jgi:hypothetical protein
VSARDYVWDLELTGDRDRLLTREREVTAAQERAAMLTAAGYATGPDDLRDLLDALGLPGEAS